jgi:hypothetical protein
VHLWVLVLLATAQAQIPSSYTLTISIPADPARSLGAANGLMPMVAELGGGNLAPGGFFVVSATAQFADGRMAFTCGLNPALATFRINYDSGEELSLRPIRLPDGFGTPRQGCEPLASSMPADAPTGLATLTYRIRRSLRACEFKWHRHG